MLIIRIILIIVLLCIIYTQQMMLMDAYDYNELLYDAFVDLWRMCE